MEPEPSNDHERAIAQIIEARCKRDECSFEGGLLEVTRTVGFLMTQAEITYLVALLNKNCLKPMHLGHNPPN